MLLLTYKALNGMAPVYLKELLVKRPPPRSPRSTPDDTLLQKPRFKKAFGERSFAFAAPTLWNPLPMDIKRSPSLDIFKKRLKTHLFVEDYFKS